MANFDWLKIVRYYVFSVCGYVVFLLIKKLVTIVFRSVMCEHTVHFHCVHVCVFSLVKTFFTIVLCGIMCGRTVFIVCMCVFIGLKVGYYSTTRCVRTHYAFSLCSLVKRLVTIVLRGVICGRTIVARCLYFQLRCADICVYNKYGAKVEIEVC